MSSKVASSDCIFEIIAPAPHRPVPFCCTIGDAALVRTGTGTEPAPTGAVPVQGLAPCSRRLEGN